MIDLTGTSIASLQNSNFHIDSKLVAIHGIDIINSNNIKDKLYSSIGINDTTITMVDDWTGYIGFITINDEILYVSNAINSTLTVMRGQYGTVASYHNILSYVYTINIFKNIISYEWSQSIGLTDRDLFTTEINNGRIMLDDLPKNWNKLYGGCLYSFKRNKEVFIWEGCNNQLVKVWEGITTSKTGESSENIITINTSDYFSKFAEEPIRPVAIFNDVRPKELLETLFNEFTANYTGNTTIADYFKINNLSTTDFSTYRDFLNYICKEYAIRLLFRKDKTINISSDLYPNKITPMASIQTEVTKINDDSSGNIIINSLSGVYKERKPAKDTSYTPIRFRKNKTFTSTINIIQNGVFQTIVLSNISYAEISTMTYQEYQMIESTVTGETYFCKLADITKISPNNYTVTLYTGMDKASKWNELGRSILEGNISITNFILHWSYDELPIIWKYAMKINETDTTSNLMLPLYPSEDFVFYIDKFGVGDTSDGKFSGIVKGFESLLNQDFTNTQLFYNQEYKQNTTVPIYLYTNKIATNSSTFPNCNNVICIGSIDNSNITFKMEYSNIIVKPTSASGIVTFKDQNTINQSSGGIYKCTIKNTLSSSGTTTITPLLTLSGQRLLKLSSSDYSTCNVGDALKLSTIQSTDAKYSSYLGFQNARYLITSKFIDSGEYYITLNDYYPMAIGTEFTFEKYNRQDIILLNELYFRANPIMESDTTYEYTNDESIQEYGTKNYNIEGKSLIKDDFLKIISYIKDTYNGITTNGIRNKLRVDMIKRLDLEAGDVIYITDSIYTKYNNQKVLINRKDVKVDTNGNRDESYEMITIGNYEISPDTLGIKNIVSWNPDVTPTYNHYGTEGTIDQEQDAQLDNNRIVLQDLVEGQIYLEEISQSTFYGSTSLTSVITSDIQTFQLNIVSTAVGVYWDNLFALDTEGVIKINSEYLSYNSLGYSSNSGTTTATVQILTRGLGGSKQGDITSNIRIQFYKTIAKISSKGLKSTDMSLGDGANNFIEVHTDTGVQIQSNKQVRVSNTYNDLFFDNTDNSSYLYMNNNKIKLGKNAISAGKDGFLLTKDSNNYLSYNITDSIFDLKLQGGYLGSTSNYFDVTNGKLYLNNGKQQIGSGIVDSSITPYNGLFIGDTVLSNGKYIKYDGTDFTIGKNVNINWIQKDLITPDTKSIENIMQYTYDQMLKGTTTYTNDLITIKDDNNNVRVKIGNINGDGSVYGQLLGDSATSNYFKYDGDFLEYKGQYFNETAYVYGVSDFIGACDTSKKYMFIYDSLGNLSIMANNRYYNKIVSKIILMSDIDISEVNQCHFGTKEVNAGSFIIGEYYTISSIGSTNFITIGASANEIGVSFKATGVGSGTGKALTAETTEKGMLIPSVEVTEITSNNKKILTMGTLTPSLQYRRWGFWLKNPINLHNIIITNCGNQNQESYDEGSNHYYAVVAGKTSSDNNITLNNVDFINIIGRIYNYRKTADFVINNCSFKLGIQWRYLFKTIINMNNIDIILNAHQESTAYSLNESLFETCYNISNVIIRTTNSTSYKALGFNSCYQINNINLSVGISKLLLNTKVTNNIQLSNWDGGSYTPYETYVPTFDSCETISNINSTFTTGRSIGAFNNCSYVVNCKINNITSDDIINITKDSNNSWNNVVLKIDDTLSHYDIETNMTTVEIKSSSFSNGKTAKLTYASGCIGKYYTIKDVDGNLSDNNFFLLQTFDNIDGMPFVKLKNPYASIILYSDGLAWKIIDDSNIKNSQIITTATYFLQFTDVISLIDTSTNTPTVILPNPTLKHVIGKSYMIKDKSGNAFTKNITISPYSSEKIDGLNSVIINVNYGSVVVVSDGTNWYRMINNTLFGY